MTPDLLAILASVDGLVPRERAMVEVLGEADPGMLSLAEIADRTGAHVSGFGTAMAVLRARRFVARIDMIDEPRRPVYRLLPRGRDAYRELQNDRAHRAAHRQLAERRPRSLV